MIFMADPILTARTKSWKVVCLLLIYSVIASHLLSYPALMTWNLICFSGLDEGFGGWWGARSRAQVRAAEMWRW